MIEYDYSLLEIVNQLKKCKYTCQGGPLENNIAFIALEEIANAIEIKE